MRSRNGPVLSCDIITFVINITVDAVAKMKMRLHVLLFALAIALLGVTEVSSVTPNGILGTCAFTNLIPSSSGAYITVSQDSAGTDTASEFWAQSETAAFGETVYFDCSNASIADTAHYGNVWDNTTGVRIVSAKEMTSAFSCQARNVLSVQPSTYGNSTVEIGRIYSASEIPADTCQTSFVNYGYDGSAHFLFQAYGSSSWTYIGALAYGTAGTIPGYCTGTSKVMAVASDQVTTLAVSSYESLTSHNAETGTFYFLGGESGSNVMNYVRGCGSDDSTCECGLTWAPTNAPTPVPTVTTAAPTTAAATSSNSEDNTGIIVGAVIGSIVGIAIIAGIAFFVMKKNSDPSPAKVEPFDKQIGVRAQ